MPLLRARILCVSALCVITGAAPLHARQGDTAKARGPKATHPAPEEERLDAKARELFRADRYRDVIPVLTELLDLRRKRLPKDDALIGITLYNLADIHRRLGEYDKAIPLMKDSLPILERSNPDNKQSAGITRYYIGEMYEKLGDDKNAATWYTKGVEVLADALPTTDPNLSATFAVAVQACRKAGDYDTGGRILQMALKLYKKTPKALPVNLVATLHDFARDCRDKGKPALALLLFIESGTILTERLGPDDVHVADVYWDIGKLLEGQMRPADALALYRRTIAIYDKNKKITEALLQLQTRAGNLAADVEQMDEARALFDSALSKAASLHLPTPAVTDIELQYVTMLLRSYQFQHARPLLDKLTSRKDVGTDVQLRFATYLVMAGEDDQARAVLAPLIPMLETHPTSGELLICLDLLAPVYRRLKRIADAEATSKRADEVAAKQFGEKSGKTLFRRGRRAMQAGDARGAVELYKAAVLASNKDKTFDETTIAELLDDVAFALVRIGRDDYAAAKANAEQGLEIRRRINGPNSPLFAAATFNFGTLLRDMGDRDGSEKKYAEAAQIMKEYTSHVLPLLSMPEQHALIDSMVAQYTRTTFAWCRDNERKHSLYSALLFWKGLLVEGLRKQSLLSRLEGEESLRLDVLRLRQVDADIASLYRQPGSLSRSEWESRYSKMSGTREALERALLRAHPDIGGDPFDKPDPLPVLREAMGEGDLLIDVFRAGAGKEGAEYHGVIVCKGSAPRFIRIADSKELDPVFEAWRKSVMSWGDASREWDSLRERLWTPVAGAIPSGTRRVFVAADGVLTLVPWQLLPPPEAPYQMSLVNSPREFVQHHRQADQRSTTKGKARFLWVTASGGDGGSVTPPAEASEAATSLRILLKGRFVLDERAVAGMTSSDFTGLVAKNPYAYVATHGMYLPRSRLAEPAESARPAPGAELPFVTAERTPLVQSGIVLGAGKSGSQTVVLATDLLNVSLGGCDMLVLAGCDSGRGDVVDGQGVLGLRSAVMAAGARTTVVSLWKVPGSASELLVYRFLKELVENHQPPARALRLAQDQVRNTPGGLYKADRHWAGWVVIGGVDQ